MSIYLDYNASAPVDPRVLSVMVDVYQNHFGNADSRTHDYGEDVRSITETARKQVADLLGVKNDEVFFTRTLTVLNKICAALNANIGDIMDFVSEENEG